MEDVLVPPGNMAELIRTNGESNLFSRMLDRFSAPYYDAATTKNYNDYAEVNKLPQIDSIFQKRYMSQRSQGGVLDEDPNRTGHNIFYLSTQVGTTIVPELPAKIRARILLPCSYPPTKP